LEVPLKYCGSSRASVRPPRAASRAREAAPHAEVEELERDARAPARLRERAQLPDLRAAGACVPSAMAAAAVEAPEVQLVDDGQHEDLEAHHVHLRAAGLDAQGVAVRARSMKSRWKWKMRRKSTKSA
jgi:hypothetical protein